MRPLIVGANHDAIRVLEILDRCALTQELRIRYHREIGIGAQLANDGIDLVISANRDRRLRHDDGEALHFDRDLARRVIDV